MQGLDELDLDDLDKDNSGNISLRELRTHMRSKNPSVTEEQVTEFFHELDIDRSFFFHFSSFRLALPCCMILPALTLVPRYAHTGRKRDLLISIPQTFQTKKTPPQVCPSYPSCPLFHPTPSHLPPYAAQSVSPRPFVCFRTLPSEKFPSVDITAARHFGPVS